jgi:hypothetical protein
LAGDSSDSAIFEDSPKGRREENAEGFLERFERAVQLYCAALVTRH